MRAQKRLAELANPRNIALLLRMISVDLFITAMLKFMQPRQVLRYLSSHAKNRTANQERVKTTVRYADFLIHRNIPVLKGACLKRSLLLYHFLRKEGLPVVVNIGVAKENGDLIGHSWLTLDDIPFYETHENAGRFNTVLSYPSQKDCT